MPITSDFTSDSSAADAARLRKAMVEALVEGGALGDVAWRRAVESVPRHVFVPGFYLAEDARDDDGLTVWRPVTARLDRDRWLDAAYSDASLITQFDGDEPDWGRPAVRRGGVATSSSTLPSLVVRMWEDADLRGGHRVLEIGTGTGYSTALACERLGSDSLTSIDVDARRLDSAASALHVCGYTPTLAVADGLYGYWPEAPFDRIVAACSFRSVPPPLVAQTVPGGKILLTLSGWLYGFARVLLTVRGDGTAEGPLLDGSISFMSARPHAAPAFGNPAHWAARLSGIARPSRHGPEVFLAATDDAFQVCFLVQCAVPHAQLARVDGTVQLTDVVTGSTAALTPDGDSWAVREHGPVKLWTRVEELLDAFDAAGRPGPDAFTLHVSDRGQVLRHPRMPSLRLPVQG